ncbi:hypothetical protein [Streptomyces zhihengii]
MTTAREIMTRRTQCIGAQTPAREMAFIADNAQCDIRVADIAAAVGVACLA